MSEATFIHVVGRQGVGKSTLVLALAARDRQRGLTCAGAEEGPLQSRQEALREFPGANVYYIEHDDESAVDALPGELVISIRREPAAGALG